MFLKNYDSIIENLYTPLNLSTNIDFVKTFKNPEHNLSFFATYLYNQENIKNTITPQGELSLITSNQNVNIIANKEFTIQSDYVKPLRKSDLLEFGIKYINRVYTSNSEYYTKNSQNIYIKDTLSIQLIKPINYTQDIFASYASIQISLNDRTKFRLGLRYEMTNNLILSNVKQTYANLLPNFLLSRKVNSKITLRFTYNNRIQRPSIYYLNPFIDNSDPTNLRLGNNRLLSENSNSFEFSLNKLLKKGSFSPYLFYRLSDGLIQPIRTIEGDITKTNFENIGKSSNVGVGYSIGFPIGKKANLNSFGSISNYSLTSPFSATQNGIIGNIGANFSFRISTKFSFDGYATYSSPRIYAQGKGNKNYFNSFTFRYKINSISRLNLIIDNPFYENVKASTAYS
jgi:outer membrane receptor protein involved in Fe transport